MTALHRPPTFAELFTPKLVTVLREGYGAKELRADALAGLAVAIVALPLSMAIAIASGLAPAHGLYAAVIGGFFVSALGGSRFQIGGPAGAFIVLVSATVARHGVEGMLLATMLAGVMLAIAGWLRLGTFVRLLPFPVTIGFTAGIAVIIFVSQLKDLLGLTLAGPESGPVAEKLAADFGALATLNPAALAVAVASIAIIALLRRYRPAVPGILVAVAAATIVSALAGLDIPTIGSRFGGVPQSLPIPSLPALSVGAIVEIMPDAFSFALLGAIESLLSATVADGMSGRRHRSNCELVGQGAANIAAALFGAMVVTGTIARTATNVRAGAHGPVAGMIHAIILLLFMLIAAPLASFVPLAALAGVLAVVAWNMIERHAIVALVKASRGDALALAVTFFLTIFSELSIAIIAGAAVGALAFIDRMAKETALTAGVPLAYADRADGAPGERDAYTPDDPRDRVAVYRISGPLFFGSAASLGAALDRVIAGQRILILDFAGASFVDSSGANMVKAFIDAAGRRGVDVIISGAGASIRSALTSGGVDETAARFTPSIEAAFIEAAPK